MSLRDEKLYIDDILEAIYKIEDYIQDIDFEDFSSDQKSIDAVIRNLEIIGDVVIAFPHKKPAKSFFRDHMEVDEKKWDEMVEDEAYEWTY